MPSLPSQVALVAILPGFTPGLLRGGQGGHVDGEQGLMELCAQGWLRGA